MVAKATAKAKAAEQKLTAQQHRAIIDRLKWWFFRGAYESTAAWAEKLEVNRGVTWAWIKLERVPAPAMLIRLAEKDGLNLHWLFTGLGEASLMGERRIVDRRQGDRRVENRGMPELAGAGV